MKNNMWRKGLVLGIIVLFVGAGIIPSMGGTIVEKQVSKENKSSLMGFNPRGDIWYVEDDGGADFTKIQDAINASSDGDTVFVYNGTYYEHLVINSTIRLMGESKNTTIIDGEGYGSVVTIIADNVNLSGFTIQNCGQQVMDPGGQIGAISLKSNYNRIFDNILTNGNLFDRDCIIIWNANNNIILNNEFIGTNSDYGRGFNVNDWSNCFCYNNTIQENIFLNLGENFIFGSYNKIIGNNFINCRRSIGFCGVFDGESASYNIINSNNIIMNGNSSTGIWGNMIDNNNISYNNIQGPGYGGIYLQSSYNNTIYLNNISNCIFGITIYNDPPESRSRIKQVANNLEPNTIKKNNFMKNLFHANVPYKKDYLSACQWEKNFWNRPRLLPKVIFVVKSILGDIGIPTNFQLDRRPALKPYDITRVAI